MHAHERIDPRRGPGRDRDGRNEIAAGVAEYEEDREDRDAREASLYDSCEDLDFNWAKEIDDMEEGSPMTDPRDDAYDAHEPDDGVAHIRARVEDDKIVIEIPVPASMPDEGLERERQAINVYDMVRSVFFPNSHAEAMKFALEILEGAAKLPAEPDGLENIMQGKITLLGEVWRRPANARAGGGKVTERRTSEGGKH